MKQLPLMLGMLLTVFTGCAAAIKHPKTETFRVAGNCDMCKQTIETAAAKKGIAEAEWNSGSKQLTLTYDTEKTNPGEILKRIAYAGYDNEQFLAPDEAYAKLPECCRYDRLKKEAVAPTETNGNEAVTETPDAETQQNVLGDVYSNYFALKDALIKSDATTASAKATALSKAISAVDMAAMSSAQHLVWMKAQETLLSEAKQIAEAKDLEQQRQHFSLLSGAFYPVAKVIKADETVYYQHCPMYNGGADWLSTESAIKNPYYGNSMLTCGKTTETIK